MKLYTMPKDFKLELTGLMKQADALLDANKKEFVCKAGCPKCCESFCWSLIEIINIRENNKYRGLLRRLRKRVTAYNDEYYRRKAAFGEAAQDDDVFQVLFKDLRCIFLHSNRCLVYQDRPLTCRLYASRDGKTCSGIHELQPEYQERANDILVQVMMLNSRYTELYHPGFNYQPYPFRFLIPKGVK